MLGRHRWSRLILPTIATIAWVMITVGPASAHGDEQGIPAVESFATAMALLQVQPDMTEMIGDKIGDGLESDDTEGVDLALARQAQKAFEAGNDVDALDLLTRATGMSPATAIAIQTEDVTRPSEVPITDQLATQGSVGRPSSATMTLLAVAAVVAIGLGFFVARRTR